MKVLEAQFAKDFIKCGTDGFKQGWHERNGGNLSYRMTAEDVEEVRENFSEDRELLPIGACVPGLAGEYFAVTGTGRYMRNLELDPEQSFGIIHVDEKGENYRIVWGLKDSRPTSELPTHLMNHEVKKRTTQGKHRVIYHAHPTNLIALTFILPLESEVFTRELWEMMTECPVIFPEGIGVVPWMVPGGRQIAVETSKLMEQYNAVVWAMHGLFCSGSTFDEVFGLMHTIDKASEIWIKVASVTGGKKRQTITPDNFRALAKDFHVTLDERFLYRKES